MLKAILNLLHVEHEKEARPAMLLLGYGFFMGVFLATYRVVAEALFLDTLGEKLDEAFLISGGLGVLSTLLYAVLQKRLSFRQLTILNIFLVLSFMSYLYYNFLKGMEEYLIYALYLMLLPITSIMLLSFWGMFGRIFDLRQSKRIIGSIDSGQLIATILAFLVTPVLIDYLGEVIDLLLLSIGSLALCMFFLFFIVKEFSSDVVKVAIVKREGNGWITLFKNNYAILLSVFISISVISFTLIDFTFLKITEQQYPDQKSLATFLSYIYLAIMLFTLFMQTFVNEKLISTYGLKTALIILPVLLLFFTIFGIINNLFFSDTSALQFSFGFFLIMGIIKFFSQSIREALENPTFKLFFMPLNIKIRFDVQAQIEGVIYESARLAGAGIIFGMGFLAVFKLVHFPYILFIFLAGYFFITGKLYNEYRNSVKKKLEKKDEDFEYVEEEVQVMEKTLQGSLDLPESSAKIFSINLADRIDSQVVKKLFPVFISDPDKLVKKFALMRLNQQRNLSGVISQDRVFRLDAPEGQGPREDIGQWLNKLLNVASSKSTLLDDIGALYSAEDPERRLQSLTLILNNPGEETTPFLVELLGDVDYNVRSAAIMVGGKVRKTEIYPYLIELLSSSTYGDKAGQALTEIGEDVIPFLEVSFFKTYQDTQTQVRILKIYERLGSEKSQEALWNKIDFPDKVIVSQVLLSLANCGYKVEGYQSTRIKYVIESDINSIIWNLSALSKLPDDETGSLIATSIRDENQYNLEHIYMLLSMIFDNYSISLIRSNLASKTNEGISYALELLDVLLSEDLKDRIIPLFDDISDEEKIKKLQVFYPHILGDSKEVIRNIINREFNQINRWTKTLALYWVGLNKDPDYTIELISNLFNPDTIIREMSAWSLYMISPDLYQEHTLRLTRKEKTVLDFKIIPGKHRLINKPGLLAFKKVLFLKEMSLFRHLTGIQIITIADILEEQDLLKGESLVINYNNNNYFYIIYDGYLNFIKRGIVVNSFVPGEFIGELLLENKEDQFFELYPLKDTVMLRIEKDKLYDVLSTDHTLGIDFLRGIQKAYSPDILHLPKTA